MQLSALLNICPGVTAIIGGGGKTTLLRTLGEELATNASVLLCTTTKIFPFSDVPLAETLSELELLQASHRLLSAGKLLPELGKVAVPEIPMAELAKRFDYVLVEADGSAHCPMKAHQSHEPVIPVEANQTICVVGASGFGRPISEVAHRSQLYAQLAGVSEVDIATPETEAAVLNAEQLHQRVYINQVETETDHLHAARLASLLDCPVVGGSLHRREYVVCSL